MQKKKTKQVFTHLTVNPFLPAPVISSPAFQKLSGTAIRVYLRFIQKRPWDSLGRKKGYKYHNAGRDGNGFNLPFNEAQAVLGINSKDTLYSAIRQLVRYGFVDILDYGNYYRSKMARYAISNRWMKYDTAGFIKVEYRPQPANSSSTENRTSTSTENRTTQPQSASSCSTENRTKGMNRISDLRLLKAVG